MRLEGDWAERFWTVLDVASYLRVKPSTVYQWAGEGKLPHYRMGKLLRFKREEIEAWTKRCWREGVDIEERSGMILKRMEGRGSGMKKRIETGRGNLYNLSRGKPDQSRGLGKEVEDGNLS